jgi:AcrR family transcriptional regulator
VNTPRAHTGRRRNEEVRQAILAATFELVTEQTRHPATIEAIAQRAGVGKQTIYRWWPSKGAIVLEALTERARVVVPLPDTGTLRGDFEEFLVATFRGVRDPATAAVLRTLMSEAQRDDQAAELVREFTSRRRSELRGLLTRGRDRGELPADADIDLAVDLAFGLLWYRVLLGRAPLDAAGARRLAHALLRAATPA